MKTYAAAAIHRPYRSRYAKAGRPACVVLTMSRGLKSGKIDQIDLTPDEAIDLAGKLIERAQIVRSFDV